MPPPRPRPAVMLAASLAIVAAVYSVTLGGGFVWDDHALIEDRPEVRELASPLVYLTHGFWTSDEQPVAREYYRPLVTYSFALDWALYGGHPSGFHATNLLLHLLCVALVFGLARRAGVGAIGSALAATAFGTFPRLSESVAWISGRTDLLATVCVLASLAVWRDKDPWRRLASALLVGLGLLSKEVAIAGVVALVVLESSAVRSQGTARAGAGALVVRLAPLAGVVCAYAGLRALALPVLGPPNGLGVLERAAFALQSLGSYVLMLADPLRPRLRIGMLGTADAARIALGVAAALGLASWLARASHERRVFASLTVGGLLPVLHLVPIPTTVLAADRFLYLPLAGLALALACASRRLALRHRSAVGVALATLVVAFSVTSHLRARDWLDEVALLEQGAALAPAGDGTPHAALGAAHLREDKVERALSHFRASRAIELKFARTHPNFRPDPAVLGSLAICEARLGRFEAATTHFRELIELEPDVPLHRFNLAVAYARANRLGEARVALESTLALHPGYVRARDLHARIFGGRP